jgi:2-polyprenyl-3-methyl-5-hydroxy-6-metoxy-1,4-benzoquinol methylase
MNLPPTIRLETKPCPVGCVEDDLTLFHASDIIHQLPGQFTIVRCQHCGLMRTNPRPTMPTIGFYYPDSYGPYNPMEITTSSPYPTRKSLIKRLISPLFQFNTQRLPPISPGRLLELGCSTGQFMQQMRASGWHTEGIEPHEKSANIAHQRGFSVFTGFPEEAPDPAQPYDLIVGWMVIEHLHQPVQVLEKLHDWLADDGWLVFSVPNAGSLEFSIFKQYWYATQLPTHLYHFTPDTITHLLDHAGWRLTKIWHQRTISNLVASIGFSLQAWGVLPGPSRCLINYPEQAPWRVQQLLYPAAYLLSLFGQTGRMTIWARKQ